MNYVYLTLSLLAALHAYLFGRWLIRNGNSLGGVTVFLLSALCISLPVYRIISAP